MKTRSGGKWNVVRVLGCLLAFATQETLKAQCPCDSEQKVRFYLRGVASMAGTATVRITYGDTVIQTSMTGGSTMWDGNEWQANYECAQWEDDVAVDPKLDQPVLIEYIIVNSNPFDPQPYTGFNSDLLTYWSRPSSSCLKVWIDSNDDNWVLEPVILYGPGLTYRIKGVLSTDDSNVGDSTGPQAGGGQPQPDVAELTDPHENGDILDLCPVGGFAMAQAPTAGEANGSGMAPAVRLSGQFASKAVVVDEWNNEAAASAQASSGMNNFSSGNGYSVSHPIGRLRWEMSLGSLSRTLTLGKLVYQANSLDGTAYSPARLSLAAGSDPKRVVPDGSGSLRQIKLPQGLLDIQPIANGFEVRVYPEIQVDPFNGTEYPLNGSPSLVWRVDNPDATPLGKVRFTKIEGANTEEHLAEWQGTTGLAGTMTITRFNVKWKEVREYVLNSSPNRRIETISRYRGAVLQHKVREVYQEFDNWGATGDVFEAVVERTEDPDGKEILTALTYSALQPVVRIETHPDGFWVTRPELLFGHGLSPVLPSGTAMEVRQPFLDGPLRRLVFRDYEIDPIFEDDPYFLEWSDTFIEEEDEEEPEGIAIRRVGYTEKFHAFEEGLWKIDTWTYADEQSHAYSYEEREIGSRRLVFSLDAQGRTRDIYYDAGFWNPISQSFSPSGSGEQALRTTTIYGVAGTEQGLEDITTVDVTVEDSFGRVLLIESHVNTDPDSIQTAIQNIQSGLGTIGDLAGIVAGMPLVTRSVNAYTDGRLTTTARNGRTIYQATYYPNGKLHTESDESGRQTQYVYDEMHRVHQKTLVGRSGDPDQITTYEYDVHGNVISEVREAGGLEMESQWVYNLAGELESVIGPDGLITEIETDFTPGWKVVRKPFQARPRE